ncbi:3-deoxy-manno-octulosonate cytidylyltransferase [Kitasatospora sp. MMS16-BH015]|uniref:3-deoxy-manno-octulosonate cytidylyltransferase n=1 Tax=Kitasatospora sp. MMS16-BH015 TaxID=2018025 RepID=UPI000CA3188A|nr:3-deoxy-manno-octulosonate cytidylyltransferase [Kitasatospora sp. MMS16-BH015]AUG75741.1 3-deoxy-manno-octulosonate cytidylyltransferase [Kitasatospora sp. MMS16-BH015]
MPSTETQLPTPNTNRHIAVIPCRWGASRFPGKPIADLAGKPLLWHVYQRCLQATTITHTVVATDDQRITTVCEDHGIPWIMTGIHPTGTDRVAECAERLDADAYINVQGDEPFIEPAAIDSVSTALASLPPGVLAVKACSRLTDPATVQDHNVVKVVTGNDHRALMFSRLPIPYPKSDRPTYLRQLGLYGFTPAGLGIFRALPQGSLERAEGVEMLRFLEHSHPVQMVLTHDSGTAVDTPEDLERAEAQLLSQR